MDTSLSIYTAHACELYIEFKLYIDVRDMRYAHSSMSSMSKHMTSTKHVTACVCWKCVAICILYNIVIVCFAAEVEDAKAVIHCLSESTLCNVSFMTMY